MFSWFSKLFQHTDKDTAASAVEAVQYKDFLIYPEPMPENGQYRLAGRISRKYDNSEMKHYRFIRSDLFSNRQEAEDWMIRKAKIFIDECGEKMFQNE